MTDQERQLAETVQSLMQSPGWHWLSTKIDEFIEAVEKADDAVPLDGSRDWASVMAASRGRRLAYRQIRDLPKHTLASLKEQLSDEKSP